jgi:uncharacterized protein (TIGR03435 family)
MASIFFEVAVRAILVATGTALVLWALRIRAAAIRHAAWTAVVLTMLVLPIWLAAGVKLAVPVLRPQSAATGEATIDPASIAAGSIEPAAETSSLIAPVSREVTRPVNWQRVLVGTYLLGALVLLARLILGTVQANRLRQSAVTDAGRLTSRRCATPITVGWFRPALILPPDWPHWPAAKLAAVLTHEAEHAGRHDPLAQWLALLNRAVFWFHPLSWWLERRLALLAEEACDAAVIAAGHSPEDYSDYLLDLARSLTREGRRLNVVGMAMPGSGLAERMRQIFDELPPAPVSRARVICTVAFCALSSVLFAAGTLAPRSAQGAASRKFEVASIKRCAREDESNGRGAAAGTDLSPGRLQTACRTVLNLMQNAYIVFADGRLNPGWHASALPIEGGPAWIKSDLFQIEAKADGPATAETMRGPMMQSLLEDRFKLKVRRETRQVPVYEMVVAKGGVRVKPFKLEEGTCTPFDLSTFPSKPIVPGRPSCGSRMTRGQGTSITQTIEGFSLDEIAARLFLLDRPVVNRTGITGLVVFSVQYDASDKLAIFSAYKEQAGIELRPATGPRDFLVIDHVEPPVPDEDVRQSASAKGPAAADRVAQNVAAPKFDVASIKECAPGAGPGPGQRGAAGPSSPGYVYLSCLTLRQLVNMSSGHANDPLNILIRYRQQNGFYPVRGGPSWVESDQFTIEARAASVTDRNILTGPMLRALLEERFVLKTHSATEDLPIYVLKVAPAGLKITPLPAGTCYDFDLNNILPPEKRPGKFCGFLTELVPFKAVGAKIGKPPLASGLALSNLLSGIMDRAVIDQTGLDGWYDLEFDYTPDEVTPNWQARQPDGTLKPAERPTSGPNIFKALENLGLKLEPVKWPMPYLVIDSAAKPRPNHWPQPR